MSPISMLLPSNQRRNTQVKHFLALPALTPILVHLFGKTYTWRTNLKPNPHQSQISFPWLTPVSVVTFCFSLFIVAKSNKPFPPENCTLVHQSQFYLRIKCQVPEKKRDMHDTYVLQIFHAESRILIGTATSQTPDDIVFRNLPQRYDDLLLFVRTKDKKSLMSDANIIYAPKSTMRSNGKTFSKEIVCRVSKTLVWWFIS